MSIIVMVVVVTFLHGPARTHSLTAPTMADCRAAEPSVEADYLALPDAKQTRGWCMEVVI